jgi:ABC-2 type transport system ATP-binding protein
MRTYLGRFFICTSLKNVQNFMIRIGKPMPVEISQEASQEAKPCESEVICARQLNKQFGEFSVTDLSFDIPRGTIFGFIGPSGSGKTTTIRLLTGTYKPTSGEVRVLGQSPARFTRRTREQIGYMPQLFFLYPHLSVWENMNFVASLYGMRITNRYRLNELLELVELQNDRNKLVRDLSGGMQRRLSLAATLVPNPKLIFLDEPTAGIDPVLRNKFWEYFKKIREEDRTFFITTQYVGEVTYCDLVGVMDNGRLLMVDTPSGIRYQVYGGNIVDLETTHPIEWDTISAIERLPFVKDKARVLSDHQVRLIVNQARHDIPDLMEWCGQHGVKVETIEEFLPPFDDVFVHLIERSEHV